MLIEQIDSKTWNKLFDREEEGYLQDIGELSRSIEQSDKAYSEIKSQMQAWDDIRRIKRLYNEQGAMSADLIFALRKHCITSEELNAMGVAI